MASKVKAKKSARKPAKKIKAPLQRAGRTSTSRLSSKNQLTVPVDIVRAVGLTAGDEVEFALNDNGFIEVTKIGTHNKLLDLAGTFSDIFDDFDLEAERDSWDR